MVGKSKKKLIASLSQKKYRDKHGLFVAEGPKLVNDLLDSGLSPEFIICTEKNIILNSRFHGVAELSEASEIRKISFLKTPQNILCVFQKPETSFTFGDHSQSMSLCLDGIQDPGNMGTILRLADWFGISSIICSPDTVDVFNPKVVQASMGALGRVNLHYTPMAEFCKKSAQELNLPVFGTFMNGENIYKSDLPSKGLIILGNEGKGIRPETEQYITRKLTIPRFPKGNNSSGMESLNVGVAAAIVCSEFKRSILS
ncbi:RNA methyltransferase [Marinilabilia rubra]|uniref:RNA methyltransferase n=2 Tax=Marinilabilia rubra TaxID=2162893 RepID=A0A2U2B5T0_9BACT|nr:RNA methyltransferase [Marinilabilia rubra]